MKYKELKIKSCPFCNKKSMTYLVDDICEYCGKNILNRCEDNGCGRPLDASARYCKACGNKSLYFSFGLLANWREEYNMEN